MPRVLEQRWKYSHQVRSFKSESVSESRCIFRLPRHSVNFVWPRLWIWVAWCPGVRPPALRVSQPGPCSLSAALAGELQWSRLQQSRCSHNKIDTADCRQPPDRECLLLTVQSRDTWHVTWTRSPVTRTRACAWPGGSPRCPGCPDITRYPRVIVLTPETWHMSADHNIKQTAENKTADWQEWTWTLHSVYFLWCQDVGHVVMEQASVTGKQGKDDNNIGSIITMLITDQVLNVKNILAAHILARMHFRAWFLESTKFVWWNSELWIGIIFQVCPKVQNLIWQNVQLQKITLYTGLYCAQYIYNVARVDGIKIHKVHLYRRSLGHPNCITNTRWFHHFINDLCRRWIWKTIWMIRSCLKMEKKYFWWVEL